MTSKTMKRARVRMRAKGLTRMIKPRQRHLPARMRWLHLMEARHLESMGKVQEGYLLRMALLVRT